MIAVIGLAAADLAARWRLGLATVLMLAVPIGGLVVLDAFERGMAADYRNEARPQLIVQESNSLGEIAGSRIPASVAMDLQQRGVTFAVAEIHTIAGTSNEDAVRLRGVDLDRYEAVTRFDVVAGRSLQPSDPPRAAMVGVYVAAARGLEPGDVVRVGGEPFDVVGVFSVGTFADNEVWLGLSSAQELLDWGTDVSIFIIPDEGILAEGEVLSGALGVARRGDFDGLLDEWAFVLGLLRLAALAMAAAATLILATVLWRIAWLRRRDLAIVRVLGFHRSIQTAFLALQGATITVLGVGGGILAGVTTATLVRFEAFGVTATAVFDWVTILRGVVLAGLVATVAIGVASIALRGVSPAQLMRAE